MADWNKISTEYITTGISYRKLAEKYGLDQATVARKAKKEDWVSKRQQHADKTQAEILSADTEQKVDRATKLCNAADDLLDKIVAGISTASAVTPTAAKNYSDALRNIKEIHMIRTVEDIEEQKARIAKLQKEAEETKKDPIRVIIDDTLNDYGK